MKVLLAGCGGFFGSIARYLLGGAIHRLVQAPVFPFGTLVVNVSGCLAIGLLGGLPIVIEIVDTKDKIERFLPIVDAAIPEGLATLEKVQIRLYRSGQIPKRRT